MSNAVSFDNVSCSGLPDNVSFEIKAGVRALIVTSREEESSLMLGLLSGLTQPDSGSIRISDNSIVGTDQDTLLQIRSKIGIVPFTGGLVSNLKVWENIFLPYLYHLGKPTSLEEGIADNLLNELKYTGKRMALPAHLSLYEKRVVAFTRAVIMKPDTMIYCNIFDKISQLQRSGLSNNIDKYHSENDIRTSIFLASSTEIYLEQTFDTVIYIHKQ